MVATEIFCPNTSISMERRGRALAALLAVLLFVVTAGFLSRPGRDGSSSQHLNVESASRPHFRAPKQNVWSDLSRPEAEGVYGFLWKEWSDLNLTKTPKGLGDNFIVSLETLQPNKSHALPYIFEDRTKPDRWAKVVLSHQTEEGSFLSYYAVGPLPVSSQTSVQPLVNREDPFDPDSLEAFPRFVRLEPDLVVGWIQFFRPGMGSAGRTLLPQGLYVRVDASKEVSQWKVGEWFYNGQMFDSVEDLRSAIRDPDSGFVKTQPNLDSHWTDTEDFDAHPDGRELPPPVSIQPFGPRYKLDKTEKYVSWFGFEFYLTTTQATGVSVFDIRFKGERVMYELSLQEALAHYAGDDPMAGGQEFLDAFFGMGTMAFELVPGYDCPAYADYLDTEIHRSGSTERLPNNVCIFEFTSDYLLSRHTAQYSVTASRNTFLTIRSVSTVGNYDYTIDYIFYLDGAIEVKVRASGYIYGAFYANNPYKNEDEYGHRVHEALSSSLHDHVINFKADLDVAGSANDMVRLAVEPTTTSYPWDQPYVKERNTMHLKEYPVTHEAGMDWPKNSGEFFLVYSADAKNAWGERRGYRVVSGTGMGNTPHLTVLNSTSLGTSARWAERDIWVVRRKDEEPRAADPLSFLDTLNPLVDFSGFADGEALDREEDGEYDGDLVVYFNVGSHHVPHSGDIPNTLMHTSASSVMFVPHNFADRDPSRESVQGVRLQLKGTRSGGFAGFPSPDTDEGEQSSTEDLRSREKRGEKEKSGYKMHEGANYFGTPYTEGVNVPLEALEPNLLKRYESEEIRVSDLGLNGSAAGIWFP
ncbi:copper amine oxidase [Diaporthe sp. PMI_573]|nr:copper amine oxidase [Diaporthaceae sp. PMI_573]